jgi:hypothetical protein
MNRDERKSLLSLCLRTEAALRTENFIQTAITYAAERWLLDDNVIVREWCTPVSMKHHGNPEALVDAFAEKYGLTDPRSDW